MFIIFFNFNLFYFFFLTALTAKLVEVAGDCRAALNIEPVLQLKSSIKQIMELLSTYSCVYVQKMTVVVNVTFKFGLNSHTYLFLYQITVRISCNMLPH